MRRTASRLLLPTFLLALVAGLAACDSDGTDDDASVLVTDVPVVLDESQGRIRVGPNQAVVLSSTVDNDLGYARIVELSQIEFSPADFTFTTDVAKTGARTGSAQGSGTIALVVGINRVPLPRVLLLTIQDDQITSIVPTQVSFTENVADLAEIGDVLGALLPEEQPDLKDWDDMTVEEMAAEIADGLERPSYPFTFALTTRGNLSGTLELKRFTFDARVIE